MKKLSLNKEAMAFFQQYKKKLPECVTMYLPAAEKDEKEFEFRLAAHGCTHVFVSADEFGTAERECDAALLELCRQLIGKLSLFASRLS